MYRFQLRPTFYDLRSKKGFTLIEMLVVTAIIAILTSVVLVSVMQARLSAREKVRISDIEQIAAALEVWGSTHGRYPSSADGSCAYTTSFGPGGCLQVLVTAGIFSTLPTDPSSGRMYYYDNWCNVPAGTSDQQYRLWAFGEMSHGGIAQNWWYDYTIGKTPCVDPS